MSRTHFFCNKKFAKNTSRPTHDSMRNNLYDIVATHDPQSPDKDTLLKISQMGELASEQKTVVYMLIDVSGSMEHMLDKLTKRLAALIPNLPNNVALRNDRGTTAAERRAERRAEEKKKKRQLLP